MVHFIHFNKYGRQQLNIQGSNQSNPKFQNPILSKSRLVETGYLIPSSESYHFSVGKRRQDAEFGGDKFGRQV